jgi:hypothetical protein
VPLGGIVGQNKDVEVALSTIASSAFAESDLILQKIGSLTRLSTRLSHPSLLSGKQIHYKDIMAAVLRLYQAHFDAYPLVTLAATNSSLTALGDIVAQTAQMIVGAISVRYILLLKQYPVGDTVPRFPQPSSAA